MEHKVAIRVATDRVNSEERLANVETALAAAFTNEQLHIRGAMAGIPLHVEAGASNVVLGRLTAK